MTLCSVVDSRLVEELIVLVRFDACEVVMLLVEFVVIPVALVEAVEEVVEVATVVVMVETLVEISAAVDPAEGLVISVVLLETDFVVPVALSVVLVTTLEVVEPTSVLVLFASVVTLSVAVVRGSVIVTVVPVDCIVAVEVVALLEKLA